MKKTTILIVSYSLLILSAWSQTFPLPPFTLYGKVQNWNGCAFSSDQNVTVIASVNGTKMDRCDVTSGIYPTVNYRLHIPMATTPDPACAEVGDTIHLEVYYDTELHAVSPKNCAAVVGKPADALQCNLFVGTDSDNDGLADEYEKLLAYYYGQAGLPNSLSYIKPDDDFDNDGFSNIQEFSAGTSPVDLNDFLVIDRIQSSGTNQLALTFRAAAGRTYRLPRTENLTSNNWDYVNFTLKSDSNAEESFMYSEDDQITTLYLHPATNHVVIGLETE